MIEQKKAAIVILNYNGKHHLEKYLPSVIQHSVGAQIIVADNASTDDSLLFLAKKYPQIEIIVNKSNAGFAKGYNDALKKIEAEYYILLNSDVEVTSHWFQPLIEMCASNKQVAGCQPIIKSYTNKERFEHAGAAGGYLDKNFYPFCRGRIFDLTEVDNGQYNNNQEVFWASGACMCIKSDKFHLVNGFDEDFFAHMEEIDLCWRLKRLGYSFHVVGNSTVYHLGGGTLNYASPKKTYLNFRNSLFMIVKNYDGFLPIMITKRLFLDGLAAVHFLFTGKLKHINALLQAHIFFYLGIKKMIKKRKSFIEIHSVQFNEKGLYKNNILVDRFILLKRSFSQLNKTKFK